VTVVDGARYPYGEIHVVVENPPEGMLPLDLQQCTNALHLYLRLGKESIYQTVTTLTPGFSKMDLYCKIYKGAGGDLYKSASTKYAQNNLECFRSYFRAL
jgi:hypothetical protein